MDFTAFCPTLPVNRGPHEAFRNMRHRGREYPGFRCAASRLQVIYNFSRHNRRRFTSIRLQSGRLAPFLIDPRQQQQADNEKHQGRQQGHALVSRSQVIDQPVTDRTDDRR